MGYGSDRSWRFRFTFYFAFVLKIIWQMCFILLLFQNSRVFVFICFSQLLSTPINFTFFLHFVIKDVQCLTNRFWVHFQFQTNFILTSLWFANLISHWFSFDFIPNILWKILQNKKYGRQTSATIHVYMSIGFISSKEKGIEFFETKFRKKLRPIS